MHIKQVRGVSFSTEPSRHCRALCVCPLPPLTPPRRVQVILEGFKSYKEQTETEPFSPKVNTIGALC